MSTDVDLQDDRPSAYWEDEVAVFRSSAIGGCDKELIGLLMGMEPMPNPKWMQDIFDVGHAYEPYIIKAASAKANLDIRGSQHQVEFAIADKAVVRSHLDGLAYTWENPDNTKSDPKFIVEAKGLGETYMKAHLEGRLFDVLPQYAWQISIQMHELELPVLYAVYDKTAGDPAELELEDALAATHLSYITKPPISKGEIRKKVMRILASADKGDLPIECPIKGGFCSVPYLHDDGEDDPLEAFEAERNIDDEERDKIATLARTYSKARAAESRAKAAKKEAGDLLTAHLDGLGLQSVDAGTAKITTVVNHRKRMDKKLLNQFLSEHGATIEDFQSEYSYSYTKVTDREDAA